LVYIIVIFDDFHDGNKTPEKDAKVSPTYMA
jgi:hypothetical protein